jgi:mono/diheme cytochrome c family protein
VPFKLKRIAAPLGIAALACTALSTGSAMAGNFTAEQATAGKTAFDSNCSQCHGRNLEGPEAPALAGPDVMQNWDTVGGLYDFISVSMPPSAPGKLGEETYVNIIAYIMQFNGATPDNTALTSDRDYAISLPAETAAGAASVAAAALDAGGAPAAPDAVAATEPTAAVPQAFTWGKQLPGGPAPAEQATAPAASTVPQAFTWGKNLPTVGK